MLKLQFLSLFLLLIIFACTPDAGKSNSQSEAKNQSNVEQLFANCTGNSTSVPDSLQTFIDRDSLFLIDLPAEWVIMPPQDQTSAMLAFKTDSLSKTDFLVLYNDASRPIEKTIPFYYQIKKVQKEYQMNGLIVRSTSKFVPSQGGKKGNIQFDEILSISDSSSKKGIVIIVTKNKTDFNSTTNLCELRSIVESFEFID